jgi:hypothetical protein
MNDSLLKHGNIFKMYMSTVLGSDKMNHGIHTYFMATTIKLVVSILEHARQQS